MNLWYVTDDGNCYSYWGFDSHSHIVVVDAMIVIVVLAVAVISWSVALLDMYVWDFFIYNYLKFK